MRHIPDRELILACQAGKKNAFEQLTKRYYQKAFDVAMLRLQDRETALDISQEAFVRVYRNISNFNVEKPFGAWLYTITRNLCSNYIQRQRKRRTVFSDFFAVKQALPPALVINTGEEIEQSETQRQLKDALNRLSVPDREIIVLKDLESFSYKEIAEILKIPQGSVMSRLYYARKRLAKLMLAEMAE